jgi:hypothetical protein
LKVLTLTFLPGEAVYSGTRKHDSLFRVLQVYSPSLVERWKDPRNEYGSQDETSFSKSSHNTNYISVSFERTAA